MKRTRKLSRGRKSLLLRFTRREILWLFVACHEICLRSDGGVALVGQKLGVGSRILESLPFPYVCLIWSLLWFDEYRPRHFGYHRTGKSKMKSNLDLVDECDV